MKRIRKHLHYYGFGYVAILALIACLVFLLPKVLSQHPSVFGPTVYYSTNNLLNNINEIRANNGKPPLVQLEGLNASSQVKAEDLISRSYWSHDTPDNEKFSKIIFEHNPEAVAVGENLAKCYSTEEEALDAWVNSPSHYENILGSWKYWGPGQTESNGCKYYVNHFSR